MPNTALRSITCIMLGALLTGCNSWIFDSDSNSSGPSNQMPTTSNITISDQNGGATITGDSLLGSYSYADSESDPEGGSEYRWLRDNVAISGATSLSYVVSAADAGSSLRFEVTPVASSGTERGEPTLSNAITVNSPPSASSLSINDDNAGDIVVGDSLTASYSFSDSDGDSEGASQYQWLRNSTPISGATSSTYTLTQDDFNTSIQFQVTPVDAVGNTAASPETSSSISSITTTTVSVQSTIPKTLSFTWSDIGADYYTLQNNPDGSSGFSQLGSDISTTSATEVLSVHNHDWSNALYLVESCDALDDCTPSSSVSTNSLELAAIGYIKASDNEQNHKFGALVDLSTNGEIAATAIITGGLAAQDQVYVYRYSAGTGWSEEIIALPAGKYARSLSISGDGNVIAVGSTTDEVYIYRYSTSWGLEFTVPTPGGSAEFGASVALARDGLTLAVGDPELGTIGVVYVYTDNLDGTWSLSVGAASDVRASDASTDDLFGTAVALSADGTTLAVGAIEEDDNPAVSNGGAVYVFSWTGSAWNEEQILVADTPVANQRFGSALALSDDGATLAAGRNPTATDGEIHIFRFTPGAPGTWALQGSPLAPANAAGFGASLDISADGDTVLVGGAFENTSNAGIDPVVNGAAVDSGAAFLFEFDGANWAQSRFIKSPQPVASDGFGERVAMSANAETLLIGASGEDSNSTGINSTYDNDGTKDDSGAIYLY